MLAMYPVIKTVTKSTKIQHQVFEFENCNMDWHFFPHHQDPVKSRVRRLRLLREWDWAWREWESLKFDTKKRRKNLRDIQWMFVLCQLYLIDIIDTISVFSINTSIQCCIYDINVRLQYCTMNPSVNCSESLLTHSNCMLILMFHPLNGTYKPLHDTYTL